VTAVEREQRSSFLFLESVSATTSGICLERMTEDAEAMAIAQEFRSANVRAVEEYCTALSMLLCEGEEEETTP
jgi:hypothetical protein